MDLLGRVWMLYEMEYVQIPGGNFKKGLWNKIIK